MNLTLKPDLRGKVAVVTGGAGVLCSEFVRALAQCGAKVAILNRTLFKPSLIHVSDPTRLRPISYAVFRLNK